MNDLETSVLTARLHQLADEMTPVVDPRRQVADARARHHRRRRIRITLIAVATATAAVAVGTVSAVDLLSVDQSRDVATPTDPTPTEPTTAPTPTPTPTPPPAPVEPAAWESRSFMGLEFAVPPGARTADTVDDVPVSSWMDGPKFTWNGPLLGGDDYSFVSVKVTDAYEGGLTPADQGDYFTVPGADQAYGGIDTVDFQGNPMDTTSVWIHLLDGDRQFGVSAQFPAGADGQQMAQRLLDSLVIDVTDPAIDPIDAEIAEVVGHLNGPVDLGGPPIYGSCLALIDHLSARLQEPLTLLQGQGYSPIPSEGAVTGCALLPERPLSFEQQLELASSVYGDFRNDDLAQFATRFGGPCRSVDVPAVHQGAVLARCEQPDATQWSLYVPSRTGADLWFLAVTVGDNWQGVGAGEAFAALLESTDLDW